MNGWLPLSCALAFAAPALAAPITRTFDISGLDLVGSNFGTAPVSPVLFSTTVTFDPDVDGVPSSTGLKINFLNLPLDTSGFQFVYNKQVNTLTIGLPSDLLLGAGDGSLAFSTVINNPATNPSLGLLGYNLTGGPEYFYTYVGNVNTTDESVAISEPSAMFTLGFGLIGLMIVKRKLRVRLRIVMGGRRGAA